MAKVRVRGTDYFAQTIQRMHLTPIPSRDVRPPIIQECVVHYECRTLHRNDVVPDALAQAVRNEYCANGDFHRIYFGEIVAAYADE
jgi:flavin reductase (DIM6/NTAB) family NADH-FMN oxidoreductase RutF